MEPPHRPIIAPSLRRLGISSWGSFGFGSVQPQTRTPWLAVRCEPFGDTRTLTTLTGPVKTFRAGFFVSDRVSIEPRIDFDYIKPEGGDAFTNVGLSLGGLFHFTPERERSQTLSPHPHPQIRPMTPI